MGLTKTKFPRADAIAVAREVCDALKLSTTRIIVAGSLRRRKEQVGDVEIIYVPKQLLKPRLDDWFAPPEFVNLADEALNQLLGSHTLKARENILGRAVWGPKNKLALHVESQIPVDLFQTTEAAWFNYLVCRTGGMESNIRIATAALSRGWQWHPYSEGFTNDDGKPVRVQSEREVFELAGLDYLEPWQR